MSDLFEERMKQLKKGYEHLPDSTSPEKIWEYAKKGKRKRRLRFSWLGGAAAAVIAGLLIVSQAPFSPGENQGAAPTEEEQLESESNEEALDNEAAIEEVEPIETPSREEEKEITYLNEGMEETDTFKLLNEANFSFSTYIPEFFQVDMVSENTMEIRAAFTADQEPMEDPVWVITEYEEASLEDRIQTIKQEYQAEGLELVSEGQEEDLEYGQYVALFQGDATRLTVVLFENNGKVIKWEKSYPGEMGDGMAARETVFQEEWEWKE